MREMSLSETQTVKISVVNLQILITIILQYVCSYIYIVPHAWIPLSETQTVKISVINFQNLSEHIANVELDLASYAWMSVSKTLRMKNTVINLQSERSWDPKQTTVANMKDLNKDAKNLYKDAKNLCEDVKKPR